MVCPDPAPHHRRRSRQQAYVIGGDVFTIGAPVFRLDKLGCHRDRKNGGYHCHKGRLPGPSFPSKEAARKALQGED